MTGGSHNPVQRRESRKVPAPPTFRSGYSTIPNIQRPSTSPAGERQIHPKNKGGEKVFGKISIDSVKIEQGGKYGHKSGDRNGTKPSRLLLEKHDRKDSRPKTAEKTQRNTTKDHEPKRTKTPPRDHKPKSLLPGRSDQNGPKLSLTQLLPGKCDRKDSQPSIKSEGKQRSRKANKDPEKHTSVRKHETKDSKVFVKDPKERSFVSEKRDQTDSKQTHLALEKSERKSSNVSVKSTASSKTNNIISVTKVWKKALREKSPEKCPISDQIPCKDTFPEDEWNSKDVSYKVYQALARDLIPKFKKSPTDDETLSVRSYKGTRKSRGIDSVTNINKLSTKKRSKSSVSSTRRVPSTQRDINRFMKVEKDSKTQVKPHIRSSNVHSVTRKTSPKSVRRPPSNTTQHQNKNSVEQIFFSRFSNESVADDDQSKMLNFLHQKLGINRFKVSGMSIDKNINAERKISNGFFPGSNNSVQVNYLSGRTHDWGSTPLVSESSVLHNVNEAPRPLPPSVIIHGQHKGVLLNKDSILARKGSGGFLEGKSSIGKTVDEMRLHMKKRTEELIKSFENRVKEMCDDVRKSYTRAYDTRLSELYKSENWDHEYYNPKSNIKL